MKMCFMVFSTCVICNYVISTLTSFFPLNHLHGIVCLVLNCIAAGRMCFSIITVYRGGSKLPVYRSYANKSFSQVSSAVHTIKQVKATAHLKQVVSSPAEKLRTQRCSIKVTRSPVSEVRRSFITRIHTHKDALKRKMIHFKVSGCNPFI